uniref:COR domain-containing protein n=1 Tax=Candidatus Electronema sp. TaxID=2698783 RepID=UPI004056F566
MNEEEIKKELEKLPKEWVIVFAARITVQCLLGLLGKKKPDEQLFTYWEEEERQKELFHVLLLDAIIEFLSGNMAAACFKTGTNYFETGDRVLYTAAIYLNADIYLLTRASFYSIKSLASTENNAEYSTEAAISAQRVGINITNERIFLKKHFNSEKTATDYFYQPLYASQSKEWLERGKKFVKVLREYGSGFDIWADWFQGRIDGIPTDKKFLEAVAYLPDEILAQEPAHINAYLKSFYQTERPLNRVRVIFLGYGEAGKTSLIRALNGLEVVAGKEQMTPGIDISTWQVPGTEITAHFWDFGGQVVAHATHQFFLRSRCLYILLLDGRTEINANEQAEYWLEHVRAFGSKAPVMLVGNKADLCAVNLDMAALKEKHGNVLDFYPLSCTKYQEEYKSHFQRFQADLIKQVAELGVHTVRFGKAHLAVLDELTSRSSTESFLKKTAWLDLCQGSGLAEQGDLNQAWLLDLFDKLGVIVHFPNIAALDSYILNPRWLTYGVYTLLYSLEAKAQKGRLREAEIVRILSEAEVRDNLGNVLSYPPDKAAIVIQAMEQFKLCFPCRHEQDMFVIPALLESDQPPHGFDKDDSLAFEFNFTGFLPRHIMPNFIVGRHDEIKGELVWQNGVVLSKQDSSAEALLQVDYHDRVLSLWVRGNKANDYFKIIYDDLKRILNLMPELRFDEFVIVPEESRIVDDQFLHRPDKPIKANFRQLLAMEDKGRTEYDCEYGTFDLAKILQIMPRAARKTHQQQNNITVQGDMIVGKTDKSISFGDNAHITGNINTGKIKNSFNTVAQSAAEPALKAELERLCQQVEQMLTQLPEEKKQEAVQDLDSFVKEATKDTPRRKWYELSAEGLIEAAKACAGMTAPVTATVKGILELLKTS